MTHVESMENKQNLNCSLNDSVNSSAVFGEMEDPVVYEKLLANEKDNFKLLSEKVKELGGVPMMLRWSDMSNTIPDEKVVVTYLMYLCARLLDIRHESRAARVIQHAWKSYKLRKMEQELMEKSRVIVVLQRAVRAFLQKRREVRKQAAAITLQKYWRGGRARKAVNQMKLDKVMEQQLHAVRLVQVAVLRYLHRRRFLQMKSAIVQVQAYCRGHLLRKKLYNAATCIQKSYRGYQARKHVEQMRNAAVKIQSTFRGHQVRKNLKNQCKAAGIIQERFRAYLKMKKQRNDYKILRKSSIVIQKAWRNHMSRKLHMENKASTMIQACWKGYLARKSYTEVKKSVVCIQACVRGYIQRREFVKCVKATVVIQRWFRELLVARQCRQDFVKLRNAAVFVQCQRRMVVKRREYCQLVTSAVKLQSYCRMMAQRRKFLQMQTAASTIQKFFRSYQLTQSCRKEYLIAKGAAMTIQAAFRGHIVRKEIRKQIKAAVTLQTGTRMFLARRRFLAMKSASSVCQSRFRAKLACRQQINDYLNMKNSAVVIQKNFRAYLCRKSYVKTRNDIIKVQSIVRTFLCQQKFRKLKHATQTIQKHYRAKLLGESCRRKYLITIGACITLQAGVRGLICRKQFKKLRENVICLQALVRGHLQQKKYQTMRSSAIKIQRRVREYLCAKQQRAGFIQIKEAATKIQSLVRMYQAQRSYTQKRNAVICLQARVRGFQQRQRYLKLKHAVQVVEKYYLAKTMGESCRKQFLISKGAAMTIQAYFRGYQVRQEATTRKLAAVKIQAVYRGFRQRKSFCALKHAVKVIEKYYTAKTVGDAFRKHYLVSKGAAMTIQAYFRGHQVRKEMKTQNQAAVRIQAAFRGYRERKSYCSLKHAVIVCQRRYRSTAITREVQAEYRIVRQSVVRLQSAFRGYHARKAYKTTLRQVTKAQSVVRGFLICRRYSKIQKSVIAIQRRFRETLVSRQQRQEFLRQRQAAIIIQSMWRARLASWKFAGIRQAAIVIQANVRCHIQHQKYLRLRSATICIQRRLRACIVADKCRREFLIKKAAAMTIQAWFRGSQVRRKYMEQKRAAVLIQSKFRAFSQQQKFLSLKNAAMVFQRHYRAKLIGRKLQGQFEHARSSVIRLQAGVRQYLCRKAYLKTRQSVVTLQAACKMYLARQRFLRQKAAAVAIQQWYRGCVQTQAMRQSFLVKKGAAITIQAYIKMFLIRKLYLQTMSERKNNAAIKIQSCVRRYLERKRFVQVRNATIACQRLYRAKCLGAQERNKFIAMKRSAILLQSQCRRLHQQRAFQKYKQSAVVIQSWYRGVRDRRQFLQKVKAATTLQTYWRAELKCRQEVMQYQHLRDMAICIQSLYRGKVARYQYRQQIAAVKIQAAVRMFIQRSKFKILQNATIRVQTFIRSWLARRQLVKLRKENTQARMQHLARVTTAMKANMAAIRIQRCYRNYKIMMIAKERLHSILVIQLWMRAKIERLHYLRDRQRVVRLQSHVRVWLTRRDKAARVIQRAARVWLGSAEDRKKHRAALKLQTLWRGHCVRMKIKNRRLTLLRKRVKEVTASATEDKKLGNRTSSALDFLLKYKQISEVLMALKCLDVSTRLSGVCCERMVETNAVSVLYKLLQCCNRSIPHMEIIAYTISILTNLAKYEKTRPALYEAENSVDILVELMQIYREKGLIFIKTCTLLGIIALDTVCKTNILEDKKLVERLRSIHLLTSRKHKLEVNQRATRARMNASSINATFMVKSPVKKHKIKPDWSLHKDKMTDIENPLKAINFVLGNLGIQGKSK